MQVRYQSHCEILHPTLNGTEKIFTQEEDKKMHKLIKTTSLVAIFGVGIWVVSTWKYPAYAQLPIPEITVVALCLDQQGGLTLRSSGSVPIPKIVRPNPPVGEGTSQIPPIVAFCNSGETIVSGGYVVSPEDFSMFVVTENRPDDVSNGWRVTVFR